MEAKQHIRPPQTVRKTPHRGRAALFFGLCFGVASGIIDTLYFFLLAHTRLSWGEDIPPYLWPGSANEPYFHVLWTFLYNLPMYILLALVFLLVGFLLTSLTHERTKYVAATCWTGVAYLALHCLLGTYFVFYQEIQGQFGELGSETVARGILIPALLYNVVAGVILTVLGLGLSRVGGLLATAVFSRAASPEKSLSRG
jgi:hypothetical protein